MEGSAPLAAPGVTAYRGGIAESTHAVHVAVTDPDGTLLASAGDVARITFLRSSAKPFQALPLVEDGVVEALGIPADELALCCGSHNGEPRHLETAAHLLDRAGLGPEDLACGPHPPMREEERNHLLRGGGEPGRIHNNCSGKHAGMLALARHHGWETEGYHERAHPVQRRMLREIARWTGVDEEAVGLGVDGCGVLSFAVPLRSIALAYARLGRAADEGPGGPRRVVEAMTGHPFLVAGTGRLCTALMEATGGRVVAKVGADGVYGAAVRGRGTGIALKVEDGDRRAAEVALVRVLDLLDLLEAEEGAALETFRRPAQTNTLGQRTGGVRADFVLEGPSGDAPSEDAPSEEAPSEGARSGGAVPEGAAREGA